MTILQFHFLFHFQTRRNSEDQDRGRQRLFHEEGEGEGEGDGDVDDEIDRQSDGNWNDAGGRISNKFAITFPVLISMNFCFDTSGRQPNLQLFNFNVFLVILRSFRICEFFRYHYFFN